ncbi:MAG: leucine-rich repeat-containing protein kinase family protein [Phormidesmis sp.]
METLERLKAGQLIGQKRLNLACELDKFPMEIIELADSLEVLELSNNCFTELPEAFGKLKKLKVAFFNNNNFETFPAVLAQCPALSMISFKGNQIRGISDEALSSAIRWLILTNNKLESLPASIGKLKQLQKLMLAGNRLQSLPNELANCQNLELIRLSANQLETLPPWLFSLPRLSWLAYSGNPCYEANLFGSSELLTIKESDLEINETLGQGASGIIYKGVWTKPGAEQPIAVAIKLFKGAITSDGSPLDEMQACIAAGSHPNLVSVLGKLTSADGRAGLVFSFVDCEYQNLGGPPSLETCTRDTYSAETTFPLSNILQISRGIAAAIAHLHHKGIMHGDLYAHNILVNQTGQSLLGDFGAASFYNPNDSTIAAALERLESRAFGCLLEDLLDRCVEAEDKQPTLVSLRALQQACMDSNLANRPSLKAVCKVLENL